MNVRDERRLGRFYVAEGFVDLENEAAAKMFATVMIVEARYDFVRREFEYVAFSKAFAPCPLGRIVPIYTCGVRGDPVEILWSSGPWLPVDVTR